MVFLMVGLSLQCQAIVVGFCASIAAVLMGWIPEGKFDIFHGLLISASAVLTASIASFVLGTFSKKCKIRFFFFIVIYNFELRCDHGYCNCVIPPI